MNTIIGAPNSASTVSPAFRNIRRILDDMDCQPKPENNGSFKCRCPHPLHPDCNPSFQVSYDFEKRCVYLKCWSDRGCTGDNKENRLNDILEAMGIAYAHLYDDGYDADGMFVGGSNGGGISASLRENQRRNEEERTLQTNEVRERLNSRWAELCQTMSVPANLHAAASSLGLPLDAFVNAGFVADSGSAWWPERDAGGHLVGIGQRSLHKAEKRQIPGSRRGLIIPQRMPAGDTVYIVEGASDTAAMLTVFLPVIGVSGAGRNGPTLADFLSRCPFQNITVVGDNDDSETGEINGKKLAQQLADKLNRSVGFALPPASPQVKPKDMRKLITMSLGGESDLGSRYQLGQAIAAKILQHTAYFTPNDARQTPQNSTIPPQYQPEVPALVTKKLSEFKAKAVDWLIEGHLALGVVSIIAGDGGTGKSSFLRSGIARLSRGESAWGLGYQPRPPISVLWVEGEDPIETVVLPQMAAENADIDKIEFIDENNNGAPFGPDQLPRLETSLRRNPEIKMVVIDPILAYASQARQYGPSDPNHSARAVVRPLQELARKYQVAVVCIAHLNKDEKAAPGKRLSGAADWRNAARSVHFVGIDKENMNVRWFVQEKPQLPGADIRGIPFKKVPIFDLDAMRILALPQFNELDEKSKADIRRDSLFRAQCGEPDFVDLTEILKAETKPSESAVERGISWLSGLLSGHPRGLPASQVREAARIEGISVKVLEAVRKEMKDRGNLRIDQPGGVKRYSLCGSEFFGG